MAGTINKEGSSAANSQRRKRSSWTWFVFSNLLRLSVWYSIITLVFRCPTSPADINSSSPSICQSYVDLRTYAEPYIEPYYQRYVAPYVDTVQPYAHIFVDRVYTPATSFAIANYKQHGAPRVAQAKQYGEKEWQRTIQPQVVRVEDAAISQYKANVEPLVRNAEKTLQPHLESAKKTAIWQYKNTVLPWYRKLLPQLQVAYVKMVFIVRDTIVPRSKILADLCARFVTKRIWPTVRIAYGRNVEPQLSKIRERLGSYKDTKKLEYEIDNIDLAQQSESLVSAQTADLSIETLTESVTYAESATPVSSAPEMTASPVENEEPLVNELKSWREKFAKASDKGARDLSTRIKDITSRQISGQARGVGQAYLTQLEGASSSALEGLKMAIIDIVKKLQAESEKPSHEVDGQAEGRKQVQEAGRVIKEKAQALRLWRLEFTDELDSLIESATASTLEVLDNVRNLGLQEIGMRWARLDDLVTHEDWKEYHELKKSFTDWRDHVKNVAAEDDGLIEARRLAEELEEQGMAIVEDAANELARLKDVAVWKIDLQDSTDDFSTRKLPHNFKEAGQMVVEKISDLSEAILGSSTPEEAADPMTASDTEAAEHVSGNSLSSLVESVKLTANSVVDSADLETVQEGISAGTSFTETLEDYSSAISDEYDDFTASKYAQQAILDEVDPEDTMEIFTSTLTSTSTSTPIVTSTISPTVTYTVSLESLTHPDIPDATIAFASDVPESIQEPVDLNEFTSLAEEAVQSSVSEVGASMASSAISAAVVANSMAQGLEEDILSTAKAGASSASSVALNRSSDISSGLSAVASKASGIASKNAENFEYATSVVVSGASSLAEGASSAASNKMKKNRPSSKSVKSQISKAAKSASDMASLKAETLTDDIIDGAKTASTIVQSMLTEASESASPSIKSLRMLADLD